MARKSQGLLSLAGLSGIVLFFCSIGVGIFHVYMTGQRDILPYALVVAVPFMTYLSFLLVSALAPSLYSMGKLMFPLTLTLPIIFSVLVMVSAKLWSSTGNSLVRPHPVLDIINLWFSPTVVAITVCIQFVALTLVGKLQR